MEVIKRLLVHFDQWDHLQKVAADAKRGAKGIELAQPPHIGDAVDILSELWGNFPCEQLRKCFMKTTYAL